MSEKVEENSGWFLWLIFTSCLVAVALSFHSFFFEKNYNFIVETACDPLIEACFQRDCSNPDDCPLNGLSVFKRYVLSAKDFEKCEREDCYVACGSGLIRCEQVECTPDDFIGESCSSVGQESPAGNN